MVKKEKTSIKDKIKNCEVVWKFHKSYTLGSKYEEVLIKVLQEMSNKDDEVNFTLVFSDREAKGIASAEKVISILKGIQEIQN